ncbi:MAG: right-handed parallel beta-helix repeat-containing protein, partial [Spirochaetota bacterium]
TGVYARNTELIIHKSSLISNKRYAIQLKNSQLKLKSTTFKKPEMSFDYKGELYVNPSSTYVTDLNENNISIIKPEKITANTQEELDKALNYAEINDNIEIHIGEGNYRIEKIITGREDIYLKGNKEGKTDITGYLAFGSCYDINLLNLDMMFDGQAYNGIEAKHSYFMNIENFRIKDSLQNGIQLTDSIVNIKNTYCVNSASAGLIAVNTDLKISKSFFENNGVTGISGINSNINMNEVNSYHNRQQSGMTVVECDVTVYNSNFYSNGITGISAENSDLHINNTSINKNASYGIEGASSDLRLNNLEITENKDYGLILYENNELSGNNITFTGNGSGVYIKGNSKINLDNLNIRKSDNYGIKLKDTNDKSNELLINLNDIKISYAEYGLYTDNSSLILKNAVFDNISDTAIYLTNSSHLKTNQIQFGNNITSKIYSDATSSHNLSD